MTYEPLARKYRPQQFAAVVGQSHITETLRAAIGGGRVAAAYLFAGQRGSGKTTVARLVAKAVNCDAPRDGEPCGACTSCVSIAAGRSLDVLEIDGASNNSVDDVRELRENVGYAASAPGKRKVYVVDEVHMLSAGAFNALLKTLEEPPPHVLFIFATTEPLKVPDTIHSRCQRFDFRRLLTEEIRERIRTICAAEKHTIDDAALFLHVHRRGAQPRRLGDRRRLQQQRRRRARTARERRLRSVGAGEAQGLRRRRSAHAVG
jgi:DNA polymerase III subunit gamma/tau